MTTETKPTDAITDDIADECQALADLLEASDPGVWDAPSLCEGWRTREVVAHMTMPVRYSGPQFMAELEAAGGDFTRLSNTVAAQDGALPTSTLVAGLRSEALHAWEPPGGGAAGALTHCVIHALDIIEADRSRTAGPDEAGRQGPGHRGQPGRAERVRRRPRRHRVAGRRHGLDPRDG